MSHVLMTGLPVRASHSNEGDSTCLCLSSPAGKDTDRDEREDPVGLQGCIVLKSGETSQSEDRVVVTPQTPMMAVAADGSEFLYDGRGGVLVVEERREGGKKEKGGEEEEDEEEALRSKPVFVVGSGKSLRLKNVTVKVRTAHSSSLGILCGQSNRYLLYKAA